MKYIVLLVMLITSTLYAGSRLTSKQIGETLKAYIRIHTLIKNKTINSSFAANRKRCKVTFVVNKQLSKERIASIMKVIKAIKIKGMVWDFSLKKEKTYLVYNIELVEPKEKL